MSESTENTAVNENKEVPTCEDKNCPVCAAVNVLAEKKEKSLHEIVVKKISELSESKAELLKKAERKQEIIDLLIGLDAEIVEGIVPVSTTKVLMDIIG